MNQQRKKFLIVLRKAPFGTSFAREALDIALAGGAFEQEIALLFMDDGVFQLKRGQDGKALTIKGVEASLPALSLYGIDKIYAESYSLLQRNLTPADLLLKATIVDSAQTKSLFEQYDTILSF